MRARWFGSSLPRRAAVDLDGSGNESLEGNRPPSEACGASLGADMQNQPMGLMRTTLRGTTLRGANFRGADLSRTALDFADLRGADLTGADLTRADLIGANLTGAILTDADVTLADVDSTTLLGIKGKATIQGWDTLRNLNLANVD